MKIIRISAKNAFVTREVRFWMIFTSDFGELRLTNCSTADLTLKTDCGGG